MTKVIKSPRQDLSKSAKKADHYRRMGVARELAGIKTKPVTLPRLKFLENAR
jgi:hypothetical protein